MFKFFWETTRTVHFVMIMRGNLPPVIICMVTWTWRNRKKSEFITHMRNRPSAPPKKKLNLSCAWKIKYDEFPEKLNLWCARKLESEKSAKKNEILVYMKLSTATCSFFLMYLLLNFLYKQKVELYAMWHHHAYDNIKSSEHTKKMSPPQKKHPEWVPNTGYHTN